MSRAQKIKSYLLFREGSLLILLTFFCNSVSASTMYINPWTNQPVVMPNAAGTNINLPRPPAGGLAPSYSWPSPGENFPSSGSRESTPSSLELGQFALKEEEAEANRVIALWEKRIPIYFTKDPKLSEANLEIEQALTKLNAIINNKTFPQKTHDKAVNVSYGVNLIKLWLFNKLVSQRSSNFQKAIDFYIEKPKEENPYQTKQWFTDVLKDMVPLYDKFKETINKNPSLLQTGDPMLPNLGPITDEAYKSIESLIKWRSCFENPAQSFCSGSESTKSNPSKKSVFDNPRSSSSLPSSKPYSQNWAQPEKFSFSPNDDLYDPEDPYDPY